MAKLNEYRALNARWLNLAEAAFYCGFSVNYFNEQIRPFVPEDKASRPVSFDRLELDRVMQSRQIGSLSANRGRVTTSAVSKRRAD